MFAQVSIFPKSQKVCKGSIASIYVANNIAAQSTFIWQDSSSTGWSNLTTSVIYPNPQNDTLFIVNVSSAQHQKKYRCIVDSAGQGLKFDTTQVSFLEVKPELTKPKLSLDQTLCANTIADTIRVLQMPTGGDSTFSFQWEKKIGSATWTPMVGATDTFLSLDTLSISAEFRVVATSLSGCGQIISDTVSINFLPIFSNAKLSRKVSRLCYGEMGIDTAVSILINPIQYYSIFNYRWQKSTDKVVWTDLVNDTTFTFSPLTVFTDTIYYRARLQYKAGCGSFFSDTFSVYPSSAFLIPTITGTQTVCFDEKPDTLRINPSIHLGPDVSYQWQSSVNGTTWVNVAGQVGKSLVLNKGGSTKFYRVKTTWLNCGVRYTDSVLVSVHQDLNPGTIKANQSICYNSTPSLLSFQNLPSGGGESYTYQWQISSDSLIFSDIPSANGIIFAPSQLTTTTYYRLMVTSAMGCGSLVTNVVKIKVYSPFLGPTISSADTICYSTHADTIRTTIKASGGNGVYAYQWQSSTNNISWNTISGQTSDKYRPLNLIATMYYRLITTSVSGCGIDTSNVIQIRVWPKLVKAKISSAQSICYDTNADTLRVVLLAQGGNNKFIYQWQLSSDGLQWNDIIGQNALKYAPGRLTTSTFYRVITTSVFGCGNVVSDSIKITVRDLFVPGIISGNQWVCYDGIPSQFEITTPPTGAGNSYSYQWQVSNDSINFSDIFAANQTSLQTNKHTVYKFYRLKFISNFGCAAVLSNVVKVSVYDIFQGAEIGNNEEVCFDDIPKVLRCNVKPRGGTLVYEYQWQYSVDSILWQDMLDENKDSLVLGRAIRTTFYRLINQSTGSCGSDISNVLKITVLPLPDTSVIIGLSEVCRNQQQLLYSLEKKQSAIYDYEWMIDKGVILTNPNKTTVFITWDNTSGLDTIYIKQTNKNTGCANYMKLPVLLKTTQAPNITEIIRKSTTNILVSKDSSEGINYQWGYIDKLTMVEIDIPNANLRYVQLPHSFDTSKYIYYVRTWFTDCITTTYYNFDPLSLGLNKKKTTTLNLYPNPTHGRFVLEGAENSEYTITCVDALGRKVDLTHFPETNEFEFVSDQLPGFYFIVVQGTDFAITKKVLLRR